MDELRGVSVVTCLESGGVHIPCEFCIDGGDSYGWRRTVFAVFDEQPILTALYCERGGFDSELRIERGVDGDIFKRRTHVWVADCRALCERRYGFCGIVKKHPSMETEFALDCFFLFDIGGDWAVAQYLPDHGVKSKEENPQKLFNMRVFGGKYKERSRIKGLLR